MAMQNPPHPGGIVKRQCLEPLGLTVTRAAEGLGVTRQALSGTGQWTYGDLGGDGDTAVKGFRLDARNVAGDADGLRSLAGSAAALGRLWWSGLSLRDLAALRMTRVRLTFPA